MGKKINQLDPLTDAQVADDARQVALADSASGVAGSATMAQLKAALAISKYLYTATGSEGSAINIPALTGKTVLMVSRESVILYETAGTPDSTQYKWAAGTLTVSSSIPTTAGERFNILYRA